MLFIRTKQKTTAYFEDFVFNQPVFQSVAHTLAREESMVAALGLLFFAQNINFNILIG